MIVMESPGVVAQINFMSKGGFQTKCWVAAVQFQFIDVELS